MIQNSFNFKRWISQAWRTSGGLPLSNKSWRKHSREVQQSGAKRKRKRMSGTRGTSFVLVISNNRLEEVCGTLTTGTFSNRLLLSNQDKGCTPSVVHSLPLPLGPAQLNLYSIIVIIVADTLIDGVSYIWSLVRIDISLLEVWRIQ